MLESAEPSAVREALSDLSPATTLVVTIDYADTEGGRRGGRVLPQDAREWLLAWLMNDGSRATGGGCGRRSSYVNTCHHRKWSNPDSAFLLPRHSRCKAFGSFSAAGILVSGIFWVRPAK
jgi:hypothetical protein